MKIKLRCGHTVTIPKGWVRITAGKVQKHDFNWNINQEKFNPLPADYIGWNVENLWCVIRKIQKSKQRAIKFRVWDKTHRVYCKNVTGTYQSDENGLVIVPCSEDYLLEQFTGLKDKNGVEIYEGDIIRGDFTWNEETTDLVTHAVIWDYVISGWLKKYQNKFQVIGNIHEK